MTDGLEAAEQELIDEFAELDEPRDKVEHIIELGRSLAGLEHEERHEANRVRGCQSQVWIVARFDPAEGRLHFRGDSDAIISRGLVAMVLRLVEGRPPAAIIAADGSVFERIGLGRLVTPGRSSGLYAMFGRVKEIAKAYAAAV